MKNIFGEEIIRNESELKLFRFLKQNFPFCDITLCDDKENHVGFHYNHIRLFVDNYSIYDCWRSKTNFVTDNIHNLKEELISMIGKDIYSKKIAESREQKLSRLLNGK